MKHYLSSFADDTLLYLSKKPEETEQFVKLQVVLQT